jgi:hypothetical protein
VAIEYRYAENQYDRLPALASDLVRRGVAVIVAVGTPAALAAKAATTIIPIIFNTGVDPVAWGLVAALNRPGANVTGIANLSDELAPKQLRDIEQFHPQYRSGVARSVARFGTRLLHRVTSSPHGHHDRCEPSVFGALQQGSIIFQFCHRKKSRFEHMILDLLESNSPESCRRGATNLHGNKSLRLEVTKTIDSYIVIKMPAKSCVVSA